MKVTITLTHDELISCITEWNADQASQFVQTMIKEGKPNAAVKLAEKLVRGTKHIFNNGFYFQTDIYSGMKSSRLRQLIKECVQEVLSEVALTRAFSEFVKGNVPPAMQQEFFEMFQRVFLKSADDPELQQKYIQTAINAIIGAPMDPATKEQLKQLGLDVDDKRIRIALNRFHPFLSKFKNYVATSV